MKHVTLIFTFLFVCGTVQAQMDSVNITFNLGTSSIEVSDQGISLSGGGNFGPPGTNLMTDEDGDGVYTITVRKEVGFSSFYIFVNDVCGGTFACKEALAGLDCSDPDNNNDRFFPPVTKDTIISTCYETCNNTTSCDATSVADLSTYGVSFTVKPTIVSSELSVGLNQASNQESTLQLISTDGRLLRTLKLRGDQNRQIDVSNLASGFYFARLQHRGAVGIQRFIKQ